MSPSPWAPWQRSQRNGHTATNARAPSRCRERNSASHEDALGTSCPIAHIAFGAGVSRAHLSKRENRYDSHGEAGLRDRPSVPRSSPIQLPPEVVERIEHLRRDDKWSERRITPEIASQGARISERTVGR
ncbi:helix-turn-helix domain-containing protein [Streptomyces sp. enrichment culture]|uniref:helix-turn-helix domain-containing protein n=1 Tax=Streptomyces sp. enrichment culture TaxID=1795815 RepID=UPI003F553D3E